MKSRNTISGRAAMLILFIVATVGVCMILYEYSRPGRNWPVVRGWWLRATLFNGFQVFSVWLAGVAWDGWLLRHRFFSLAWLGTYGGALLGYFAITFVF